MKILSLIKQFLIWILTLWSNAKDSVKWSLSLKSSPKPLHVGNGMPADGTSLIIAPHADDELIGCYNYIKRHPECIIYYCGLLGSKYTEENGIRRKNEFISFCKSIGVAYCVATGEIRDDIERIIDEVHPANILIPSYIDWHSEHRLMSRMCYELFERNSGAKIIWYRISVPIMSYNYSIIEDNSDFQEKWNAFKKHYISQKTINIRRFKFVEKKSLKGPYAAELFYIQTYVNFRDNYKRLINKTTQLDELKLYLSDYKKLVIKSESLYHILQNEY